MTDPEPPIGDLPSVAPPVGGHPNDWHAESSGRVRQVTLRSAARTLSTLPRIDYDDAFLVEIDPTHERTGEQWARAVLEDAPMAMRRQLRWGWFALGLKLDLTRSERRVLGWELRHSPPDRALLGARSRLGMPAELLFKPEGDTLLFATFVQQRNPIVRGIWTGIAPTHQTVVPYLLKRAARAQQRG
jgi:hypothetical protein